MQQLQWLSGCMKDKRKWFWLAMALAVVSAGLCVVFPFITQQITDRVLVGQTLPDGSVQRPDTAARPAGVRYDRRAAFALVRTLRHDGVSGVCVPERPAGHPPPFVRQPVHPGRGLLYAVPHGRPDDAPDGRSGHGAPHGVLDLVQRGGEHLPVSVFHDISVQCERRADAPSAGRCPGDPCMLVPVFAHGVSSVCVPAGKAVPHELGGAGKHRGQQNGARVRARGL